MFRLERKAVRGQRAIEITGVSPQHSQSKGSNWRNVVMAGGHRSVVRARGRRKILLFGPQFVEQQRCGASLEVECRPHCSFEGRASCGYCSCGLKLVTQLEGS